MKNFPSHSYHLESPLAADEITRRLTTQLAEKKEFCGTVAGNSFHMYNHTKLPAIVTGTVNSASSGSTIAVKVRQDIKLTFGELVLLVVAWPVAMVLFPDFMHDPFHTMPAANLLMLALYGLCFYSEIDKSQMFLAEVAEIPMLLDDPNPHQG